MYSYHAASSLHSQSFFFFFLLLQLFMSLRMQWFYQDSYSSVRLNQKHFLNTNVM